MIIIIITETKDRTHKQSMRFFCLLFYRKPTLSEVCWASRASVTSLVTHTRFAVGFTRWHSADRKLQVANRRSISNLYQTQVWYLKISDLGEAEVWYLVVHEWLKVHYSFTCDCRSDFASHPFVHCCWICRCLCHEQLGRPYMISLLTSRDLHLKETAPGYHVK